MPIGLQIIGKPFDEATVLGWRTPSSATQNGISNIPRSQADGLKEFVVSAVAPGGYRSVLSMLMCSEDLGG